MHCKDVSVHDVDVDLTSDNISRIMDGWTAYVRTEYIVFRSKGEYAVVRLERGSGRELFSHVSGFETISLPGDTVFMDDPSLDVLNTPRLAEIQRDHPGKTVVVRGMFSHMNFISGLEPTVLRIVDNVPPAPSKLSVLVRMALDSGFVDVPIVTESIEIDMAECVSDVRTGAVMFPCKVSGLTADIDFCFLDEAPDIGGDITLIGCHLSKRIFESIYGRDVPFINVCPVDHVPDDGVRTIVKCCKIKTGHVIDGCVAKVPWGATVPEVVGAINDLFGRGSE